MNTHELLREKRLLEYKMYSFPKEKQLTIGKIIEKNLYNSSPISQTSNLICNSVIVKGEDTIPILWGEYTIQSEEEITELKSKLKEQLVRIKNPITSDYIRQIGWKYPLHFYTYEESKHYHIILMPPKKDTISRIVYLNGKLLKNQQKPSLMYSNDWRYIKITPIEIERGGDALKPKKDNNIYQNFKGIHLPWLKYGTLKLTDMSWMTTGILRKMITEENLILSFKFQDFDVVVIPNDQHGMNEVYVNGIEQRHINPFSKLHTEWFKATKNLTQEDIDFRRAWRALLGLDLQTQFKPNLNDKFLSNYYQGVILKNHLESHLSREREKYEKENADPFVRAKHYIENFLARQRKYGKRKNA